MAEDTLIPEAPSPEGAALEGQPEIQVPEEPAHEPEAPPDYRFKVEDESAALPRDYVDGIAERLGWQPTDVLRSLGVNRKYDRRADEIKREKESLAAREAQLSREISELQAIRQAAQGFDPNQLDPNSRFVLQRLDALESGLNQRVGDLVSRLEAREQEQTWAEEIGGHLESINSWAEQNGRPVIEPRKFLKAMLTSGAIEMSGGDWETACVLQYKSMAFDELMRSNGNGNGKPPVRQPAPAPRTRQQSFAVPAASTPQVAPRDDTKPVTGETIEQKRDRLRRALGSTTLRDIVGSPE